MLHLLLPAVAQVDLSSGLSSGSSASSFDRLVIHGDKTLLVMFGAPWCSHCKALAPVWEELEEQHEDSTTLVVGTVDCSTDAPFCNKHAVPGLPTIMTFHPPDREGLSYEGGKSLAELQVFARKLSAACDVSALASCSAEQREELRPYLDMPIPELRKKARRIKESLATAHYQMEKGRQAMVALEGAPGGRKGSKYKEAEEKWMNLQRALKLMQIKVANSYRPMRAVLAALPKEEQEAEASTTTRKKKRKRKGAKDEV